jgi:hypothetical protein
VKALDGAQSKGTKLEDEVLQSEHDYLYDEKHKTIAPGESGIEKVERALGSTTSTTRRTSSSSTT